MRALLFTAIADGGYGAPENIARYLLDHDEPDLADVREIARYWLRDEADVDAIVTAAAELARATAAAEGEGHGRAAHPPTASHQRAGGNR